MPAGFPATNPDGPMTQLAPAEIGDAFCNRASSSANPAYTFHPVALGGGSNTCAVGTLPWGTETTLGSLAHPSSPLRPTHAALTQYVAASAAPAAVLTTGGCAFGTGSPTIPTPMSSTWLQAHLASRSYSRHFP